jgi:hypothetical protein
MHAQLREHVVGEITDGWSLFVVVCCVSVVVFVSASKTARERKSFLGRDARAESIGKRGEAMMT